MKVEPASPATILGGLILSLAVASAVAQTPDSAATHGTHPAANASMSSTDATKVQQELVRLREQVRQLEQRMRTTAPATTPQSGGMPMGGRQSNSSMAQPAPGMKMAQMRMMDDDMDMPMSDPNAGAAMSGASGGRMGMGMGMMEMMRSRMSNDDMVGMGAMGGMKSSAAMATPSALPGFPGQSHLYHIGATGFFLDHPQHIALNTQQQQMLAQHKQQSLLRQSELQRQIDAAEEKLWQLTGADQPQIASIDKQVREIERLRADQRIAFIRAVGEAAKALTDQQRKQLTGMAPAQSADPAPMPMPDSTPSKDHM